MAPAKFYNCACPCGCTKLTKSPRTDSEVLEKRARCSGCAEPAHRKEHPSPDVKESARVITPFIPFDDDDIAIDKKIAAEQQRQILAEAQKRWVDSLPEKFRDAHASNPKVEERLRRWRTGSPGTAGLVILGGLGEGKCLVGETLIPNPVTGIRETLENVVLKEGFDNVYTMSSKGRVISIPISAKVDTGFKETLKVTLRSGRSLTVTPEHPFLLPEGWVRADKISVGDTVAAARKLPHPTEPVELPDAEVDFMAVILAEGCTRGSGVTFSSGDASIIRLMENAAAELGLGINKVSNNKYDYRVTGVLPFYTNDNRECECGCGELLPPHLETRGKKLQRFIRGHSTRKASACRSLTQEWGMLGVLAKEKKLPEQVYRLPAHQLARFLAVFWMCDGYVDARGPAIGLGSKQLTEDIQHVLLRLGIHSQVNYKAAKLNGKVFDSWRLKVLSGSFQQFYDAIPLWGEKRERLEEMLQKKRNPNSGFPAFTDGLKKVFAEIGLFVSTSKTAGGKSLSLRRLSPHNLALVTEKMPWIVSPDIWWDEVLQIEQAGVKRVFDLSVHETHCFVANDVIVHNTFLSVSYANAAIDAGLVHPSQVLFGTEAELLSSAANSTFSEVDLALRRLINPRYKMIVIDDVGRGTWIRDDMRPKVFSLVFDAAYRDNRVLVITTNLIPKDLTEYIGEGAMDRLRSMVGYDALDLTDRGMREKVTRETIQRTKPK